MVSLVNDDQGERFRVKLLKTLALERLDAGDDDPFVGRCPFCFLQPDEFTGDANDVFTRLRAKKVSMRKPKDTSGPMFDNTASGPRLALARAAMKNHDG